MKRYSFFAALALATASCSPPPKVVVVVESTPKPAPTPHPAKGATEAAIRLYPDLAKKDSTFNRTFVELYEQTKTANPESLTAVDWPLDVARRTAAMLGVLESPTAATPAPVVKAAPSPVAAREPGALDRGPYNETRGVARPPVLLDKYGNRVPVR